MVEIIASYLKYFTYAIFIFGILGVKIDFEKNGKLYYSILDIIVFAGLTVLSVFAASEFLTLPIKVFGAQLIYASPVIALIIVFTLRVFITMGKTSFVRNFNFLYAVIFFAAFFALIAKMISFKDILDTVLNNLYKFVIPS
ncbi:hypothetical protein Emin_0219 [Elusimicrobium minutum Pei191]|uniref:Uncharacterized protein n=1 Tax=Elusimicrobium minutum (strain Pei191) TaxID=445932 RepID=B2KB22_ELUMP|nr:hypothetical protein [Elusimicrobium minutum]ACC97781.1 hypothetical protein Emin_0219 [Elusimicrobium minutum Pei191]